METTRIEVDRAKARAIYRQYKTHTAYAKPIDWEIQRTYQLMAQGRVVIKAIDSIIQAGVGDDGLPKLAIARADATKCWLRWAWVGADRHRPVMQWVERLPSAAKRLDNYRIEFPEDAFPRPPGQHVHASVVPLIPVHLRPKRGLQNYHILYEAVWRPEPPVDPLLLRRVGQGDLWVVVAAWDLTEVERAALAARISG